MTSSIKLLKVSYWWFHQLEKYPNGRLDANALLKSMCKLQLVAILVDGWRKWLRVEIFIKINRVIESHFQPPVPPRPWSGIKKTIRYKSVCPQDPVFDYTQSQFQDEDCLYLNIFVPYEVSVDILVVFYAVHNALYCQVSNEHEDAI